MKDTQSKRSHFQPFSVGLRLTDYMDGDNTVFAHAVFLLGLINESVHSPEGHFSPAINSASCVEMAVNITPFILTVNTKQDNGG